MKKIYLTVLIVFVASAILFISSLFYLDKEKHRLYYFSVNIDGHEVGTIKIDKFVTDDNLLYKSYNLTPFMPLITESKVRLTLDRKYGLINYLKEDFSDGAESDIYLERQGDKLSYVGTHASEFEYLGDLPVKSNTFVFEEDSPVTYLPILENYDFSIGRAQAFSVVTNPYWLLPPMKRLLTLTSIRDEYIKVGSKKVKVECLLVRMKDMPQGMLWVTKTGRSLVAIEFPDKKLKIMRVFSPKNLKAEKLSLSSDSYTEEDVKFNNKKNTLAGTLIIPKEGDIHPAAILIGGYAEGDRDDEGLFTYIADSLGKAGFISLRFDKRGTGASGGDSRSVTNNESFDDAVAALNYLQGRKDVDVNRIVLIGHGKGALYAVRIAGELKNVKGVVLMSPMITPAGQSYLNFDNLNEMAAKYKWDEQYRKLIIKSRMETMEKIKDTKGNWTLLLGRRCFLKNMKEGAEENPTDIIRKVECPVLMLHGKENNIVLSKDVASLDKALEESGNKNHNLIYYGYLGHFFGKLNNDGVHRMHYEADRAVLDNLKKWLDANI